MSLFDYHESLRLSDSDPPFASLIMSAIRKADSTNIAILRSSFPEIWRELEARYDAPDGVLPGERGRPK